MPGVEAAEVTAVQDHEPVVPMPGRANAEAVQQPEDKPSIPQPNGTSLFPENSMYQLLRVSSNFERTRNS